MKRGRFYKGAFQPFCWIVGPPYRMNKERFIDDRATQLLLLTSLPCHLKGEVAEASLKAKESSLQKQESLLF